VKSDRFDPRRRRAGAALLAIGCLLFAVLSGATGVAGAAEAVGAAAAPGAAGSGQPRIDLNHATLEELMTLPISEELARQIYYDRTYVRYFDNIYDLMDVEGMTPETLELLKPLVTTLPPEPADVTISRLWASYRQVRSFLGQEGSNEGLVDEYLDQLRDPVNVNELDLFDLLSYQNVSPVDASNILKARDRLGGFENARQLRNSEGLRYWAYRNLRDFVVYEPAGADLATTPLGRPVRGSYELRYYNTPYMGDDDELNQAVRTVNQQDLSNWPGADPHMTHKLRLDLTEGFKAGLLTHRNLDEESWHETTKGYFGLQDHDFGALHLKRIVMGNYRVAFGQGLVMDNTDFVLYRKTGFGWNKRPVGIRGDLSRSREFALRGAAVEGQVGRVHGTFFASTGKKDGIMNANGTVNQYVLMYPRLSKDFLTGRLVQRDAFREEIVGGNVKFLLAPGTYVGLSGYNASYNKGFQADVKTLVQTDDMDLLEARDSEIYMGYTSVFVNPDSTVTVHKFRRVYGAEFQTVFSNVSVQGEYAWLQDPRTTFLHGYVGDAWLLNSYFQWDDLELLAIYRDYDVGFDNPYNRAFSNDTRYEQTLLDANYRLNDPLFSYLAFETPQPKPERGLFFDSRYRISRNLIVSGFQYDQWERKADGMDMRRFTLKGEYQPIFNLRLRVRQRFSSRSEQMPEDVRRFLSWETRFELHALLSNYNRLKFMYMTSNVHFPARQRLSYPPDAEPAGDLSGLGTAGIPAHAFQAVYEHNITEWFRLLLSTEIYDGFLWNFEGNEFVLLDGTGFRNWLKIESRVSEHLLMQLKVTRDHNLPLTYVDIRQYGDPVGNEPDGAYVPLDRTTYRLQIDYTF
jgi:DNA uptake protein ComE-like DNA-binding protein